MQTTLSPGTTSRTAILVVDDEAAAREALGELAGLVGAEAVLVPDAASARAAASERRFGCALVDKNLEGESGLTLVRDLKRLQPDLDVIIVTGFGDLDSAVAAFRLGAADYLVKPFDPALVRQRLDRVMERHRMLAENAEMQRMLARSERLAWLGTLAASVAHEVNNPLAYLTSNIQFIRRKLRELLESPGGHRLVDREDAEDLSSALDDSVEGAERIRVIVHDLRAFARGGADEAAPVDVAHAVDNALKVASVGLRDRALIIKDYAEAPRVQVNEPRLVQVFVNLIVNAGQSFPEDSPRNEIRVRVRPRGGLRVEAEVRDNGPGLSPEARAHLFERFFTTKPLGEGTGLGLSISRDIVRQMGGVIEVESEPGRGASFKVVLPARGAPPLEDPDADAERDETPEPPPRPRHAH